MLYESYKHTNTHIQAHTDKKESERARARPTRPENKKDVHSVYFIHSHVHTSWSILMSTFWSKHTISRSSVFMYIDLARQMQSTKPPHNTRKKYKTNPKKKKQKEKHQRTIEQTERNREKFNRIYTYDIRETDICGTIHIYKIKQPSSAINIRIRISKLKTQTRTIKNLQYSTHSHDLCMGKMTNQPTDGHTHIFARALNIRFAHFCHSHTHTHTNSGLYLQTISFARITSPVRCLSSPSHLPFVPIRWFWT